jgi:hypothetical protein
MADLIAYIDGGSLGNPGPAGVGVVIEGAARGRITLRARERQHGPAAQRLRVADLLGRAGRERIGVASTRLPAISRSSIWPSARNAGSPPSRPASPACAARPTLLPTSSVRTYVMTAQKTTFRTINPKKMTARMEKWR